MKNWINRSLLLIVVFGFIATRVDGQIQFKESAFLPAPTGLYSIGTTEFFLKDSSQLNYVSNKEEYKRLHVKIWYPSDSLIDDSSVCNNYLEGYDLKEIYKTFKSKGTSFNDIQELAKQKTNSIEGLPISATKSKYPMLIFTPAYMFGCNDIYSSIIENLASNGYIICSVTHVFEQICIIDTESTHLQRAKVSRPYFQYWLAQKLASNKKSTEELTQYFLERMSRFDEILGKWQQSTLYLLSVLKNETYNNNSIINKIDFENIGAFGHSFGGALSNQLCLSNPSIKASVNMDCFQFGDMINTESSKPIMLIESDYIKEWQIANSVIYRNMNQLSYHKIAKTKHFAFTDLVFFDKIITKEIIENMIGEMDGRNAIEETNGLILDFFNKNLF